MRREAGSRSMRQLTSHPGKYAGFCSVAEFCVSGGTLFGIRRVVRNGNFAGDGRPIPHFLETEATPFSYRKYAGFVRSGTKVTGRTTLVIALWTLTLVPSF
jgi:hypothetical protein